MSQYCNFDHWMVDYSPNQHFWIRNWKLNFKWKPIVGYLHIVFLKYRSCICKRHYSSNNKIHYHSWRIWLSIWSCKTTNLVKLLHKNIECFDLFCPKYRIDHKFKLLLNNFNHWISIHKLWLLRRLSIYQFSPFNHNWADIKSSNYFCVGFD